MNNVEKIFPHRVFEFGILNLAGLKWDIGISDVVITTWLIMLIIICLGIFLTHNLKIRKPSYKQIFAETIMVMIANTIKQTSGFSVNQFLPLIATFWIFLAFCNLIGLIPYLNAPTRDISLVISLSSIAFCSIYYFGIKFNGWRYLKVFFEPNPVFFPLNLTAELGKILSLTFRLFGNILGWEIIIYILVMLTGLLVPVPLMMFSILSSLIQAYIFGTLALVYIISGIKIEKIAPKYIEKENWYEL